MRQMVTDDTAGHRAQHRMMMGGMTGDSANHRALDAAFRIRRHRHDRERQQQRRAMKKRFHVRLNSAARAPSALVTGCGAPFHTANRNQKCDTAQ
jgi:hypothetical protein